MINDDLNDSIKAAFCAHHHIKGDHERNICPLPEGYCHVVGQLALSARRLENQNQQLRSTPVVTVGRGGSGATGGAGGAAYFGGSGGAGGGAYYPRSKRIVVRYKDASTGQIVKYGMQVDLNTCDDEIQIDLRKATGGSDED